MQSLETFYTLIFCHVSSLPRACVLPTVLVTGFASQSANMAAICAVTTFYWRSAKFVKSISLEYFFSGWLSWTSKKEKAKELGA